jgi:hypothetical protein
MGKRKNEDSKDIQALKKLFALHMMKCGTTSREIRNVLKMGGTAFKKFMPIKKVKPYKKEEN